MSFRYNLLILPLSFCHILHGSTFGSFNSSENFSFSEIEYQTLSKQGSSILSEISSTPLLILDTNKPKSRTATPSQQSKFLIELNKFLNNIQNNIEQNRYQYLSPEQSMGLDYRNRQITKAIYSIIINDAAFMRIQEDTRKSIAIYSMIINDAELLRIQEDIRKNIANIMMSSILDKFSRMPQIWDVMPQKLKQQIIHASTLVSNAVDLYFYILEEWITLEEYANYARLCANEEPRETIDSEKEPRGSINSEYDTLQQNRRRRGGGFTE